MIKVIEKNEKYVLVVSDKNKKIVHNGKEYSQCVVKKDDFVEKDYTEK